MKKEEKTSMSAKHEMAPERLLRSSLVPTFF